MESGNARDELVATVALIRSKVIPSTKLPDLFDVIGSAVTLVQMSEDDRLDQFESLRTEIVGAVTPEIVADAEADVDAWKAEGYEAFTSFDSRYPTNLRQIFNRPPLLFLTGTWEERTDSHSISIVGTRQASEEGLRRTRKLTTHLVDAGFTILSGLAQGVDTVAHQTALDAHGRTVAVMGTGLAHRYPRANRALSERIREHGALISQFFPHQGPTKWTFPMRNIVMSGLSLATVVVEASHTSGARVQARVALQHGRTVFLLRSLVQSHQWAWEYVNEGRYGVRAIEVESTDDILSRVNGNATVEALTGD